MQTVRENVIRRPGQAAAPDAVGANGSMPQPATRPLSAASIFKHPPVAKSKADVLKVLKPSTTKRTGPRDIPDKLGHDHLEKRNELHPLAVEFNDTTSAYRQNLLEKTTKKLDEALYGLLKQLHDHNAVTSSSPPPNFDPKNLPRPRLTRTEKLDRIAAKCFEPLSSVKVEWARSDANGDEHRYKQTLGDGLAQFKVRHEERFEEIRKLERKWEIVVGEIWKVGINCLGEDVMSTLLLADTAAPPSPSAEAPRHSLNLADLDPKPARKKVKFDIPPPKPPKFISAASRYPDLPVPTPISTEAVETLKGKINGLGVEQIDSMMRIKKDGDRWWEKKQAQMVMALKDD